MKIETYTKSRYEKQIKKLFREIYPDWDELVIKRMAYDDFHHMHIKTKVVIIKGEVVGQTNAFWIIKEKRVANLGYHISPRHHKKGIGLQLTQTLIDEVSESVDCFIVLTTQDNIASQMLCKKLGFTNPPTDIANIIKNTEKYKRIKNPYLMVLSIQHENTDHS